MFFLTSLGEKFLLELYRSYLLDDDTIAWIAVRAGDDTAAVGFVVGTKRPGAFYRRALARNGVRLAWAAGIAACRRPMAILRRVASALREDAAQLELRRPAALLGSLGVNPACRGGGVGQALVRRFCAAAWASGAHAVYLTTDEGDNVRTRTFYEQLGFAVAGRRRRVDGPDRVLYVIDKPELEAQNTKF